jgi:hypothetical protein
MAAFNLFGALAHAAAAAEFVVDLQRSPPGTEIEGQRGTIPKAG